MVGGTVLACAVLLALVPVGCDSARRPVEPTAPPTEAQTASSDHPEFVGASLEATADELARLLCLAYEDWPVSALNGSAETSLATVLSTLDQEHLTELEGQLERLPLGIRASDTCPEVVPAASLAGGRLPRPAGRLESMPGTFLAEPDLLGDEARSRYEWTAVGLGCLSLRAGADQELRDQEAAFLAAMGFDRDSYVRASLTIDDDAVSERIFRAVLHCAERADTLPPE